MLINLEKQKLTLGQLKNDNLNEFISVDEKKVIKVITAWQDNTLYFDLTTSGSTGKPSHIRLHRDKLTYSAHMSIKFLDPDHRFSSTLLCINPDFIGGLMVIVRSLVASLNLTVIPPSSALANLPSNQIFDLTSMVPMQLQYLMDHDQDKLQQFRTILIGGAPLAHSYIDRLTNFPHLSVYQTYGMTETASHIALKNLSNKEEFYKTLGDTTLALDERECLRLKGTITDQQWIQTNDIARLNSKSSFQWLGRIDFVINSGGIKIHPEIIEQQLSSQIKLPFFVAGMDDDVLGQKVILFVESKSAFTINFEAIEKYKRPKEIKFMDEFCYTSSGKINRSKTLELIKQQ